MRHEDRGQGFLKALDFSDALDADDPTKVLQTMTEAFNYECRVLDKVRRGKAEPRRLAVDRRRTAFDGEDAGACRR